MRKPSLLNTVTPLSSPERLGYLWAGIFLAIVVVLLFTLVR
jgi:hypothetical protein